jgi:alkylation response protein AidB-like acyl-CoA dehydrogenase
MALVLTEDQLMLKEAAKTFIADLTPVDAFRRLRDAGETHDAGVWTQMAEMGWTAIAVPEAHDGLEFGLTGLGLLAIECGRQLVASPLLPTAAAGVSALVRGHSKSARARLLPRIVAGEALLALAVDEGNHHDPDDLASKARRDNGGFVLNGRKSFVAEGSYADFLVVVARDDDGGSVLLLVDANASGVTRRKVSLMDARDYAEIEFNEVAVAAENVLAEGGEAVGIVQNVIDTATICTACELYGCARETFEQTVGYLGEREQFGQPIGSFQALQHRAAHAFSRLELLKSVILDALDAAERGRPDLPLAASHAKALANDTAELVTSEGIQMHGGIGLTDELDIGLYFKRVRTLRNLFGNSNYHRRRFARLNGY